MAKRKDGDPKAPKRKADVFTNVPGPIGDYLRKLMIRRKEIETGNASGRPGKDFGTKPR